MSVCVIVTLAQNKVHCGERPAAAMLLVFPHGCFGAVSHMSLRVWICVQSSVYVCVCNLNSRDCTLGTTI